MWFQSTICAPERDTKARCAAWFRVALSQPRVVWALVLLNVIPVNVVLPGAAARVASTSASHACTRLFIKAHAQHALAADAASRRARSCVFQRQFLLQCGCHQLVAAPLKRNPFDGSYKVIALFNARKGLHNAAIRFAIPLSLVGN